MEEIGLGGKLTAGGKTHGLVLDVGGYYKNVFTLAPSLFITEKEIDLGTDLFEECLQRALKELSEK
jgi:4-aminobutyrate aminotransferase-like enzyme